MKRKIIFILFAVCLLFSAIVVPSFAWSFNDEGLVTWEKDTYLANTTELEEGTNRYYPEFHIDGNTRTNVPMYNLPSHTNIRVQWYNETNGNIATIAWNPRSNESDNQVTFYGTNNGQYPTSCSLRYRVIDGSYWFETSILFYTSNVNTSTLRCRVTFEPNVNQIQEEWVERIPSLESHLLEQIETLENDIAGLNNTISGLQNNNVLDGIFSGIGSGFSAFVTPLLSLGVGGVTLGNVIAVLLIIGAILVFVLLINKIRGA